MKPNRLTKDLGSGLIIALSFFVVSVLAQPATAHALGGTAANAVIKNSVTANYKDASGTNSFTANAYTLVTVSLVRSAVLVGTSAGFPAGSTLTVNSGANAVYNYYTLNSQSNGADSPKLIGTLGALPAQLSAESATYTLYRYATSTWGAGTTLGTVTTTTPTSYSVPLGATSAEGWNSGTSTLTIPGGVWGTSGLTVGTAVTVGGVGPFYIASLVTAGSAATAGAAEVQGGITLGTMSGGPALSALTAANTVYTTVGEYVYIGVTITGNTTGASQGTVADSISTTDSTGGNATAAVSNSTIVNGTAAMTLTKTVFDCGASAYNAASPCSGSATNANPGDVLEYTVTVINPVGSGTTGPMSGVNLTDHVPAYTSLVTYPATYASGGVVTAQSTSSTNVFCNANNGGTAFGIEIKGTGTSNVSYGQMTYGSGSATDATYAGSNILFYLGTGSAVGTGGTLVPAATTYTFQYRVQVK
jgi:hypothetical protein